MAQIPLYKYVKREYPETPKSTIQYWATQAFYHGKGPFAHLGVTRIGCRWYYRADDYDPAVDQAVSMAREILGVN